MPGAAVQYQTRVLSPGEGRAFVFGLDNIPEILGGATIVSAVITGPGNTPLVGVTAGTPSVLVADAVVDAQGNTVAAGEGVVCALFAPSSAGQDYIVECHATLSNGAIVVIAAKIAVRVAT